MSRAERLLQLMQVLRRHRFPVSGAALAEELQVSLRTLYRDIASLQSQGALIEGEAGLGYVLKPGFVLPPLMFSEEELEALVLGSRWVANRADSHLAEAARNALSKIEAVLPIGLRIAMNNSTLLVGPRSDTDAGNEGLDSVRLAIRSERKLTIGYQDLKQRRSTRTIWPFALGYFDNVRVVVAWCELRQDIRHFRFDRISDLAISQETYPRRRAALLKDWKLIEGIAER
jgi:predicted DNA-binding transcriptional regulator YafY